jgi:hypothetical protein
MKRDLPKLDQWQIVFDHAQSQGLYLHFKLQEQEIGDNRRGQATPAQKSTWRSTETSAGSNTSARTGRAMGWPRCSCSAYAFGLAC